MIPPVGIRATVVLATVLVLAGCAGVDLYTERTINENTPKTGIPIYGTKPYLLVARTEAKEKPVEVSIVYLPDSEKVVYAVPRSGLGFAKTSLSLVNGQLSSFNQESDAKMAELVTSLAGLVTARGAADKASAEADSLRAATLQSAEDTTRVAKAVRSVADDIGKSLTNAKSPVLVLTERQRGRLGDTQLALNNAAKGLENLAEAEQAPARIAAIKAQADELEKIETGEGLQGKRLDAQAVLRQWAKDLRGAVQPVEAPKPAKPTFELYEIRQTVAGVTLMPASTAALSTNPASASGAPISLQDAGVTAAGKP